MKALALVVLAACGRGGGSAPATPTTAASVVPEREPTPADAVMTRLPAGADVLIELDLARLRGNEAVGSLATDLLAEPDVVAQLPFVGGIEGIGQADAVVLASYDVGTAQARTITLVTAGGSVTGGEPIAGDGLDTDTELLALRARAMPAGATGAVLRVTARLDFDARVSLASQLRLESAPSTLSLWSDVADDLAVVATVESPDEEGQANSVESSGGAARPRGAAGAEVGRALAASLEAWRDEVADHPAVGALGLAPAVEQITVTPRGEGAKVVAVIGPRRLSRVVRRLRVLLFAEEAP